jgi:hypothetical protein
MSYFNPHPTPLIAKLRLEIVVASKREVVLEQNGRPVRSVRADGPPVELLFPALELAPGVNRFTLRSPDSAVRLSSGRYQLRTFGLKDSSITIVPSLPVANRPTDSRLTERE